MNCTNNEITENEKKLKLNILGMKYTANFLFFKRIKYTNNEITWMKCTEMKRERHVMLYEYKLI